MTVKVIVMTENTCHTRCMRMDAFLHERFHCALKIYEFFIDEGISLNRPLGRFSQ